MLTANSYVMGLKLLCDILKEESQCGRDRGVPRIAAPRFDAGDGAGILASYLTPR